MSLVLEFFIAATLLGLLGGSFVYIVLNADIE